MKHDLTIGALKMTIALREPAKGCSQRAYLEAYSVRMTVGRSVANMGSEYPWATSEIAMTTTPF